MSSSRDEGRQKVPGGTQRRDLRSRTGRGMGRVTPRRGRPTGPRYFEWRNPTPVLSIDEEQRRVQRGKRFADPQVGPTLKSTSSARDWSAAVWEENAASTGLVEGETKDKPLRNVIGLGRATGLSRVPDTALSNSRELMESRVAKLILRTKHLEEDGHALVSTDARVDGSASSSDVMEAWETILGDFRQLTMAVTASPLEGIRSLALGIYEAAADACLLGGNLSFYLACQSRLLSEIYEDCPAGAPSGRRRDEFVGYSLLYFGVFSVDNRELAAIMRRMSPETFASPFVTFSLAVLVAYRNRDAVTFVSLYNRCSVRQKTLLSSSLDSMRRTALSTIIRSYLALDKRVALSRVGLASEADFLELLEAERPDLLANNAGDSVEYKFRSR